MMKTWWIAARPASLIKIILPISVGLSIGYAQIGESRLSYIVFALVYGWLNQLVIIFLNDYADAEADSRHADKYPKLIDARAIPNGWITRRNILFAGILSSTAMLLLSAVLAVAFDRLWTPVFATSALGLLFLYSFEPVKLNYRGLGEILETLGVGGVLPWLGFYLYTGDLRVPLTAIVPIILLAFASSVSSGIKHMPADLENGKNTTSVMFGSNVARVLIVTSLAASILCSALLAALGLYHTVSLLFTVGIPLVFLVVVTRHVKTADHSNLVSLKVFKGALHKAIYATNLGIMLSYVLK